MTGQMPPLHGVFLAPGVSKNKRFYSKELIGKAVARMQAQIVDPDGLPIAMRVSHGSGDRSDQIVARIIGVDQGADGAARYEARWYDTRAAHDIAALVRPADGGLPGLRSVSISGEFLDPYQTVVDGESVCTADDLAISMIDFTASPGVTAAVIDPDNRPTESATAAHARRMPVFESWEPPMPAPQPVPVMSDEHFNALLANIRETAPRPAPRPTPAQAAITEAAEIRALTDAQLSARLLERLAQRATGRAPLAESTEQPATLAAATAALPAVQQPVSLSEAIAAARDPHSPLWNRGAGQRTFFTS